MKTEHIEEVRSNALVRKRLAKLMASQCFRNTKLEDFHVGTFPSSEAGDYSDVRVVSPYGEIPWNKASRLSDEEMKMLMIDVVNHCHRFVALLFSSPVGDRIIENLRERDVFPKWNDPEL